MKTTASARKRVPPKTGFTLIEILVVIAIIGILAAILVPVVGKAQEAAKKRRAAVEMNTIKVAVMEFYKDHNYMPSGEPPTGDAVKIGDDAWPQSDQDLAYLMRWLTGENPMGKAYLVLPEKSQSEDNPLIFVDPWQQSYRVGMDRNLDGVVQVVGGPWNGQYANEKVLVYSLGPETPATTDTALKTFDIRD